MADDVRSDFLEIPASTARCFMMRSTEREVRRVDFSLINKDSSVSVLLSK